MKVFVVVQHFDRGSDEVSVEGVFASRLDAEQFVDLMFRGWEFLDEDATNRPGYYAEPDESDSSDYVFISEQEVQ